MSVSPIVSGAAAATTASDRTSLGRDQFLQLLVTQLRNQDPISPLQPHEFAAQLAQFTSVEQLSQLNTALASQTDSINLVALLGQTTFAAGLLGRHVVAEGNQVSIPGSGAGQVTIDVAGTGGEAKLHLYDASGKEVAVRDLGAVAPGRRTLTLPGDLPAGSYTYRVDVTGADGKTVAAHSYVAGVVDGVLFKDGQIVLKIGTLEIPIDTVAEVESAAVPPTTSLPGVPLLRIAGGRNPLTREDLSR